jgi:ATP-dependent Zn protease
MRPTRTEDFNKEPRRCDAYHEAGHAVIGVILNLRLNTVTGVDNGRTPPNCSWDYSEIDRLQNTSDDHNNSEEIYEFTRNHAMMCLASKYAERLACDTSSDEQEESLHYDYLDAERIRYNCTGNYLGKTLVGQLRNTTETLVQQHRTAIERVAKQLLNGQTLNHAQILSLIRDDGSPP